MPMPLLRLPRRADVAFAATAVAGVLGLAVCTSQPPAASQALPDLYMEMPAKPYNEHVAPIYVDAFEMPGRLLYRFDTVVRNQGGIVDIWRDPDSGHVMQAIWPQGVPSPKPDPNTVPAGKGVKIEDRSASGARFEYAREQTHEHFHFQVAASYALEVPGGAARRMPKVGFCMHDTYGDSRYFVPDFRGSGQNTWCAPEHPDSSLVRMGLSNEAGDLYDAATELQWIDVTGLEPGRYRLSGTANPRNDIHESSRANNTLRELRTIPGVIASQAQAFTAPGRPVPIPLAATVVAPEIPARQSADCRPGHVREFCYTRITARSPVQFAIVAAPTRGTAALGAASGASTTLTYTPGPAGAGRDTLGYTATDGRGLVSRRAAVAIEVTTKPFVLRSAFVRRTATGAAARLDLAGRASVGGRLTGPGTRRRTLKPRRLGAGTRTLALGRLARGSYTLVLRVRGARGSQTARLKFTAG